MRILFLCDEYPPAPHGGLGSFTQTLAEALAREGHQVQVTGFYRLSRRQVEEQNGVRVVRLPRSASRFWSIWLQRLTLARELQSGFLPDLLEGPELSLAFLPRFSTPRVRILRMHGGHAFFSHEQGQKPNPGRAWFERLSFQNADFLCAVSLYVAESTRALLHFSQPVRILPNPVNTDLFAPRQEREREGSILFSGTLCAKKGVEELLQAWPLVSSRMPEARLLLVGRDQPDARTGQPFSELLRQRLPPACFENVLLAGRQPHENLPRLLAQASLCVVPSLSESFGISLIEAMSAGKAIAASDIPPFKEILKQEETGLFFNPREPRSIAETILQGLQNSSLRRQLGQKARQEALQKYSIAALTPQNLTFYEECLQAKTSTRKKPPQS